MKMSFGNQKCYVLILVAFLIAFGIQGSYGQAEQPEETPKFCQVGDVIAPGESCTYVADGKNIVFSVKENGEACRAGGPVFQNVLGFRVKVDRLNFCRGDDIERDDTFNSNFAASKNPDSSWTIDTVPAETPVVEPEPVVEPDFIIESLRSNKSTFASSEPFTLSVSVKNSGDGNAPSTTLRYYRSTDNNISTGDTEVSSESVSALEANRTSQTSINLKAPTSPGTYYYGVCVDSVPNESDTNNNCSVAVKVTVVSEPDLIVDSVRVSRNTLAPGESFTLSATFKNQGPGASTATTLRYYRSTDNNISTSDTGIGSESISALEANHTGQASINLTAPTSPGTHYYGICLDNLTNESDTNNNCSRAVSVTVTAPPVVSEDVNADGIVNIQDMVLVAAGLGQIGQNAADVNGDGLVNIQDLVLVAGALGTSAAAPSLLHPDSLETLTSADVRQWLSQAQDLTLTDTTSLRGIQFLEQLLASLIPKETALLPNYPNPFNPETWMPYQLAKDADVTLIIYAVNGQMVRRLVLGHQAAGMYQDRSRAVYWDGRNAFGEPVASGVYFYTLTTGDFTATRKMLILK